MAIAFIHTPLGTARLEGSAKGLSSLSVSNQSSASQTGEVPETLKKAADQLQEYFAGQRTTFDLELDPKGTDFQKKVWTALLEIPYGTTVSYMALSKSLGDVKAIRAVAAANGKNPLWIIIPCHRVVGSDGSLTGYAGGLGRKRWLLEHESPVKQQLLF